MTKTVKIITAISLFFFFCILNLFYIVTCHNPCLNVCLIVDFSWLNWISEFPNCISLILPISFPQIFDEINCVFMSFIRVPWNLVQCVEQIIDPLSQNLILNMSKNIGIKDFLQMLDPCSQNLFHAITILKFGTEIGLLFSTSHHLWKI